MEHITNKDHSISYFVLTIKCIPFIKHDPKQPLTIYTAITHAIEVASEKNQNTVALTFNQQLWIKARDISESSKDQNEKLVVILLGLFHLIMSYLGSIGYIMGGSGLEALFALLKLYMLQTQ